jgi:hypothetical protein
MKNINSASLRAENFSYELFASAYKTADTTSILPPQPYKKSLLSNLSTQPYHFQGS